MQVKTEAYKVKKSFKLGEMIRIIQGNRSGESGIVTQILKNGDGEDSHAVITMINDGGNRCDLTVLLSNLRIKVEVDPNTQAAMSS